MKPTYIFLANGFEEVEALATLDVLRRGGMNVITVSINSDLNVTGAHGVSVVADTQIDSVGMEDDPEFLVLPGGMPGASNLAACEKLCAMLREQNERGGNIAAICASPSLVLFPNGILRNRKATCYPGMEPQNQSETEMCGEPVVMSENVITGMGPAWSFAFGLAILSAVKGEEVAESVAAGMLLR